MKVRLTQAAIFSLEEIWRWNAKTYGVSHADSYIQFMREQTQDLAKDFSLCKSVPDRPALQYIVIKKSNNKGLYGHIAIYRMNGEVIEIIDYFHTAQDWQKKLN